MQTAKPIARYSPPGFLVISLMGVYLFTLAPGLTWANHGSDGGDLISAAFTGGIAHPTGYPLYLLLARLFQALPLGSLAYRTNLMSAGFTALGAALVYRIVVRSLPSIKGNLVWLAGLAAGYAFGLAPLVWSQAVITEVYALQAFLVLLILSLYAEPDRTTSTGQQRLDRLRGLALGLGVSNHITTLLLLPIAFALGFVHKRTGQEGPMVPGVTQLLWFGLGCSLYLTLPLRALAHPPVNWGNPLTPGRLWWLVSGSLYRSYYFPSNLAGPWDNLRAGAALLLEQVGLPGLLLGLTGLVFFWKPSRLYLLSAWTAFTSLAFAVFYLSDDSYIYLIPLVTCFAIWIGLGVGELLQRFFSGSATTGLVVGLFVVAYLTGHALTYLDRVDASHDERAEVFSADVLSAVPENAMVFAKGDRALFALWTSHFALGQRPDVTLVATDLLHFDWYQETLRSTYPSLILPGPFPWPESVAAANPARATCAVQYTDRTQLECSQP